MTTTDLRLQRAAVRLYSLPTRIMYELLAEIGRAHGITGDVLARAELFADADPDILRLTGGDQFPPRPLHLVPRHD